MKCTLSEKTFQWQHGTAWSVGKIVHVEPGDPITRGSLVLMAHSHTRELEFVESARLKPSEANKGIGKDKKNEHAKNEASD